MVNTRKGIFAAAAVVGAAALWGCGGANLKGRVTDAEGTQQQALRADGDVYGGAETVASASLVRASSVQADGSLKLLAQAQVSSAGRYDLAVPAGELRLIVQALSDSGAVVGSVLVETTGSGGERAVAPIDTETSVEAEVFLEMVKLLGGTEEANAVDVRARLNAKVAAEVKALAAASSEHRARVRALAEATVAAQKAQLKAYADNGVQVTQQTLFEAQLGAAADLHAALDRGDDAAGAHAAFLTALGAAAELRGADEQDQSKAESCASAAFRATVRARIGASAAPLTDAALRAAAALEARASAEAISATLTAASAAQAAVDQANQAGAALRADVAAATSASASAAAFAELRTSVTSSVEADASVLSTYLEVSGSNRATLTATVGAAAEGAAVLSAALDAGLQTLLGVTGSIDLEALSTAVVDAYGAYEDAVRAEASSLGQTFGATQAEVAVELLLTAQASYR